MSYSMCPYCEQAYLMHESHICKLNDSVCSRRSATNYNFQIPIQEQANVREMSSLSKEFHDSSFHIGNVSYELSGEASVLQDQSTLHTNPANMSDGPALTLPSFQSTFINRLRKVNQEIPLSPPDRTYQMSNPGENYPFICGVATAEGIHNGNQNKFGEANNCHELNDRSCNIQSANLLNEPSEVPNQEGLPEDNSFAFQPQKEIETGDTKTRVISQNFLDNDSEVEAPTHSRLKKHICLDCGKRFICKAKLERHAVVHSGERPFICDTCKKSFNLKDNLKSHKVTHTGIAGADVAGHSRTRQNKHTCQVCGKGFPNKSTFESHSVVHSDIKPFNCEICKKDFKRKSDLKKHMLKHQRTASADNVFVVAGPSRSPPCISDT